MTEKKRAYLESPQAKNGRPYEERLYAYLERDAADDSQEAVDEYNRRIEISKEFKSEFRSRQNRKKELRELPRQFTYDMLDAYCKAANVTVSKLYEITEAGPGPVMTKEEAEIAKTCDSLPEEKAKHLRDIALSMSTNWWQQDDVLKLFPTEKVFAALLRIIPRSERRMDNTPAALFDSWSDQHFGTAIPFKDYPEICDFLSLPIRWVFGITQATVFGNKPVTQDILDAYSFIPPNAKPLFYRTCITFGREAVSTDGQ